MVPREVTSAGFALSLPAHPGQTLRLSVALIRDLRRPVQVIRDPAESKEAWRWDADLAGVSGHWGKSGWVATPTPSAPTAPTLIPIGTTASSVDAGPLAQLSTKRWSAQ